MWSSTDGELKNSLGAVSLKRKTSARCPASDLTINFVLIGRLWLLTWTVETEEETAQSAVEIKMKAPKWL